MKLITLIGLLIFFNGVNWLGDFSVAKKEATEEHKLILINFSGSDWCGPCIRLRKEILESKSFVDFAASKLILVRADFPRERKNQLSKVQVQLNDLLADKYNPEGKFPFTLLIDAQGKILKTWDGFPNESAEKFVEEITVYAEPK